ncbi:MAG: NAD(P)/FAD-dependent oxidoreductase [Bacteroidota bacterium]
MKISRRKFVRNVAGASAAIGTIGVAGCAGKEKNQEVAEVGEVMQPKGPAKEKYDAIVVGAGLSGLNAAVLLEEAGYDVLVLEGRKRLGGRVYTLENVPGKPEAAGEYIGANYARMINMVQKMNLEMFTPEFNNESRPWMYQIQNEFITAEDWPSHPMNPQKGEFRDLLPHRYLWTISNKDNPLEGQPLDAWLKPEFQQYDIPNDQWLRSRGLDEETIRLMNVTIHSGGMHRTSALNELRRYHVGSFNSKMKFPDGSGWKMITGGNSKLPAAMANSLNNEVILGKTVVGFTEENNIVEVSCSDGTAYKANHVICSIPITVLQNVTFEPRMEGIAAEAIDQMGYGLSIQAHFQVMEPYWEKDGKPANMWTDGPLERIAVRTKRNSEDPDALVVFVNGPESLKFRLMSDEQVFAYCEKKMAEMRPSTKGTLKPLLIQSCERDIHGAGDWVYWQPGQVTKFGNHMRPRHGNIHFCGEHTAIMERGMEGAFESGERAALEVIMEA